MGGLDVRVIGLSNADRLDLPDYVGGDVVFERLDVGEDLGEPFTIVAVLVTVAAVKGFVAWMASRSTENPTHEVTAELEVSHPDGTTERRRITVKDRGQPMTADLARELSSFTSIPVGELLS